MGVSRVEEERAYNFALYSRHAARVSLLPVSAKGDALDIDGSITGPIPEGRLVPHDNNIAASAARTPVASGLPRSDARGSKRGIQVNILRDKLLRFQTATL
jgi:hypothetical protein